MADATRIPPQNLEAEMSTLGALMLDANAAFKVIDYLRSADFYRQNNKTIYETIIELIEKREPVDMLSVANRLQEKNALETVGGRAYLTDLINSIPTAANIGHYAEIVHKKGVMRELLEASQHINDLGYREEEDVGVLLDQAESKIFSIAQTSLKQSFVSVGSALDAAWKRIDDLHKNKGGLRGVPTGFTDLDNVLSGLQPSDLIILAARPSLGKTSLALDIARNAAINHDIPVGIFSLEMSSKDLVDRFIAAEADIDMWKLRTGRLSSESDDFTKIASALERLSKAPIFIDDVASNNILQMRAMARRLKADKGLGLIVVDYLQLMQPRVQSDNMVQQITEISRSLKQLAKELDVPVLALSQLSRAVEQRHPPRPRLSDLRDSGSIEQDADVVMFIYREDKYKQNSDRQNQADILIEKHRNGPLGQIALYFNQHKTSFSSLAKGGYSSFEA
ncbi:MAG: replicative DNA helicase [Candidatus Niyogibacteria bacterium RIFCSPLOWO2_01_FULL_45_48]|uniref:Replicative DNA helicase n=2 Tax=Candidatus Niyogiibacteriota TaxID=1817912 RepID=A0A1G2EXX3_9BACT|nr:MAG: replicative DNA helicase [Candidatus Niyogibacteria bacterium RIFCSPHIGHO2_01_FULL_45_28]OGZ30098.1 MAG: replicative DNA helicase [Candidatus Niyogibacteria bacterium RIFCSPLOWO2_02_FULL_45_13]OGZ31129.1 MAG: replicative DNA helicase [Candidatus Niyogibacteria bacterium RIFCSPLOWO2_01_FULL_45_48]